MFKGLKSKLEDEAKRLQATVTQYGENIAQQVRTGTSENGSDISGYTRRLFSTNLPSVASSEKIEKNTSQTMDEQLLLPTETIISLDDDEQITTSTHLSQSVNDFLGERVRRASNASLDSNDSTFTAMTIPQSSSALRLEPISSDMESNTGTESTSFESTSREQLSLILHKLQNRAADYKKRYNEVTKCYQEIVRENEKCRSVLATTQDKALQRIGKLKTEKKELMERVNYLEQKKDCEAGNAAAETKIQKLQDLLEKCKDRLAANKTQIASLTEENSSLKSQLTNLGQDPIEKVTAEWKGRVDRLEEEWSQRLADCDEKATIAIATSKAEMHTALQQKDQELEKWIVKCHTLEKQDADGNQRWQLKVDELNKLVANLESEKADMIEKLSRAKQEGVKLVKEEEENKRAKLQTEFDEKLTIELLKKDDEWRKKLSEFEEQMELAIEEREMQKAAALMAQDKRFDELTMQIENLKTENIRLNSELDDSRKFKLETANPTNDVASGESEQQSRVLELEAAVEKCSSEKLALEEQNKALTDDNNICAKRCKKLENQYEESCSKLIEINATVEALNSRITNFTEEKEIYRQKIADYESELAEKSSKINEYKENISNQIQLEASYAEILRVNKEKDIIIAEKLDKIANFERIIEKLQSNDEIDDDEYKSKFEAALNENKLNLRRCEEFEANLRDSQDKINVLEKEIEDIRKRHNVIIEEKNAEVAQLKATNKDISLKNSEYETKLQTLNSTRTELEDETEKVRKQFDSLIQEKNAEIAKMEAEIKDNLTKIKDYEVNIHNLKNEWKKEVLEVCQQYDASINKKNTEIVELISENESVLSKNKEYEAKLQTLNSVKVELEKEIENIRRQYDLTIKEKDATIAQFDIKNEKMSSRIQDYEAKIRTSVETELQKDIEKVREECELIIQEKDAKIAELKAENEHISLEMKDYEAKFQTPNSAKEDNAKRINELEELYNTKCIDLQDRDESIANLRRQINEFNNEKNANIQKLAALETQLLTLSAENEECEKKRILLEKENRHNIKRCEEADVLYKRMCANFRECEAKAEDMKNRENQQIDALTQENAELLRRCDELETLCELSKPTELEYLRNVLYRYMTERETLGKEVVVVKSLDTDENTVVSELKEMMRLPSMANIISNGSLRRLPSQPHRADYD